MEVFDGNNKSGEHNSTKLVERLGTSDGENGEVDPQGKPGDRIRRGESKAQVHAKSDLRVLRFRTEWSRGNTRMYMIFNKETAPGISHLSAQVAVFSGMLEYITK